MLFAALTEHGRQKVSRELKDKRPINSKILKSGVKCAAQSQKAGAL